MNHVTHEDIREKEWFFLFFLIFNTLLKLRIVKRDNNKLLKQFSS